MVSVRFFGYAADSSKLSPNTLADVNVSAALIRVSTFGYSPGLVLALLALSSIWRSLAPFRTRLAVGEVTHHFPFVMNTKSLSVQTAGKTKRQWSVTFQDKGFFLLSTYFTIRQLPKPLA
jgi:hypothetical protein